jgi:hypothetical protein
MLARTSTERGGRHEGQPPRRGLGWLTLLGLTLAGIVAALLAGGRDSAQIPETLVAPTTGSTTSPTAEEPSSPPSSSTSTRPSPTRSAPKVVERGAGTFVHGPATPRQSRTDGRVIRWTLEAERGIGVDLTEYAETVHATLHDRRGWQDEDDVRFVRVTAAQAKAGARVDVRMLLASPDTTDRLCAPLRTDGKVSCWNEGRAVLNSRRWLTGADAYEGRLEDYRAYLVNHEIGHGLGYGHESCPAKGKRAPVMLQQTVSLRGCAAWPYPKGDGSRSR